jgi:hypothetical protein
VELTITETFNDITSGAVIYQVYLAPTDKFVGSGVTLTGKIPAGFNNGNINGVIQTASNEIGVGGTLLIDQGNYVGTGSNDTDVSFSLDTSGIENGTYDLFVIMADYAGNTKVVNYYLYVVNPLQFVSVTQQENNQLKLNFSTSIKLSGLFVSTGFESGLRVVVQRTGTTIDTQIFSAISNPSNSREIIISIVQNQGDDQFNFNDGDIITVTIEEPGIARLFNLSDEAILQLSPNKRLVTWVTP